MVRLYVEYLDTDTTKLFETAQDYSSSKRMAWGDADGDGDQDLLLQGPRLMVNTGGLLQASTNTGLPTADQDYTGVWGTWTTMAASISSSLGEYHQAKSALQE